MMENLCQYRVPKQAKGTMLDINASDLEWISYNNRNIRLMKSGTLLIYENNNNNRG